jgi:hypothetical protein
MRWSKKTYSKKPFSYGIALYPKYKDAHELCSLLQRQHFPALVGAAVGTDAMG